MCLISHVLSEVRNHIAKLFSYYNVKYSWNIKYHLERAFHLFFVYFLPFFGFIIIVLFLFFFRLYSDESMYLQQTNRCYNTLSNFQKQMLAHFIRKYLTITKILDINYTNISAVRRLYKPLLHCAIKI